MIGNIFTGTFIAVVVLEVLRFIIIAYIDKKVIKAGICGAKLGGVNYTK